MNYLIWEIFCCLILTFILGLFVGYLLKALSCRKKLSKLEKQLSKTRKPRTKVVENKLPVVLKKEIKDTKPITTKSNMIDDLKEISGVGPQLEQLLNINGINNFQQIAELKVADIKELSKKLGAFKNRIVDDKWVSQAKKLYKKKYS